MSTELQPYRTKPLVLLVDDYLDTLEALEEFLKMRGFDVLTAADGVVALEMAREHLPDVMLLDMQLPGFTGIEVARMLKEQSSTQSINIIAFTANMYEYLMEEAIGAGCASYLTKPAGPDAIENEIWRVIARA
ncbi:MAG: response regulator [Deltaproteobacteria bacterium]|nr:response regulator [Deltaproteobacteria bacterium]